MASIQIPVAEMGTEINPLWNDSFENSVGVQTMQSSVGNVLHFSSSVGLLLLKGFC